VFYLNESVFNNLIFLIFVCLVKRGGLEMKNLVVLTGAGMSAENIEKGKSFLKENAKRPGVVTLPSGLQYEVITEGNGKKPSATDRVKCHYEGTLIDGTLFDSSIKRGEPAIFGVNQVIKGWVEALQLMTEGAKWKLFIPSELAYGAQQAGEMIPPHSTLIFEVELIEVL
jgi:FKBP-type peptidyl-prolyl cis-trans isomerase FklB